MKSTLIAFTCTFFEVFDVPVFWPILVMYFIGMFLCMIKFGLIRFLLFRVLGCYISIYYFIYYFQNSYLYFYLPFTLINLFKVLTCLTMKRQIMHMIRYRYIPFTTGKPRPKGKEDSGKVVIG